MSAKAATEFLKIDRRILADSGTSGESGRNLHHLCDRIGPRFAGTPGYRAAADYMLGVFKKYRLDSAELEPFEFLAWRRGEPAELAMLKPFERPCPCYALPYGAPTAPGGVEADVVSIGAGSEEEIEGNRKLIKGGLVLTTSKAAHRTDIFERCASLGAAGFILASGVEGMALPTGTVANGERTTMPAVGIGHESALQIERFVKEGTVRFRLTMNPSYELTTCWNVVGELTGTESPDELVVMGGHLDSHEIGPGAMDNAAGAVQVMEAARLLSKQRKHLKRTVRFIGFGAEEVGLLGSHHHAKKHSARLRRARFMLNSDCPGLGSPKGLVFHECPGAREYVESLSREMDTPIAFRERFHSHSDHYPFVLKGLPTAGMSSGRFSPSIRYYAHMAADTPDKISLTDLRDGAALAARMLLRASSDEDWPLTRRSPAEIKRLLSSGS